MRVLYPQNPLNSKTADDPYHEEYSQLLARGIPCSLFDFDALNFNEFKPQPKPQLGERVLYRGWMLTPSGYAALVKHIQTCGAQTITSVENYQRCHHLPGWYSLCKALTAKTRFFDPSTDIQSAAAGLGWPSFFVKDFVKSNTGDKGSIARSPAEIPPILEQLIQYRGQLEGGIALRQVEDYIPDSEQRHFITNGQPHSPISQVPDIVHKVAKLIQAPFYSVDTIQTTQGDLRIVELGDGQVSDKKNWPLEKFIEMLLAIN